MTIVLHQWVISPFCNKVRRVLDHKQLEYSVVNYNGLLARKAAKLSPAGKLPVLDYDGERIADSPAIAEFLDRKHPERPLYPSDPADRARAMLWQQWADETLFWYALYLRFYVDEARTKAVSSLAEGRSGFERALLSVAVTSMYRKRLRNHGIAKRPLADVEKDLLARADMVEAVLTKQPFLVGNEKSIADFAVQAQFSEIMRTSHLAPQLAERSHVVAWLG